MKKLNHAWLLAGCFLVCFLSPVFSQDQVVIDKQEATNFLERNWIWITIAAIAILILLFSGSSGRKSVTKTTIVKDDLGNVKRVETTKTQD